MVSSVLLLLRNTQWFHKFPGLIRNLYTSSSSSNFVIIMSSNRGFRGGGSRGRNRGSIISARMSHQNRGNSRSRTGSSGGGVADRPSGRVQEEGRSDHLPPDSARSGTSGASQFSQAQHLFNEDLEEGSDSGRSGSAPSYYPGSARSGPSHASSRLRHPPHLKGREIGLWYAKQNQHKKKERPTKGALYRDVDSKYKMELTLTANRRSKIQTLLNKLDELQTNDKKVKLTKTSKFQREYVQNVRQNQLLSSSSSGFGSPSTSTPKAGPTLSSVLLCDVHSIMDTKTENETLPTFPIPVENFRDPDVDLALMKELQTKAKTSIQYNKMMEFRKKLPAYSCINEILEVIIQNQVVVLEGETGCGKTTQVPQFILDRWILDGNGSVCKILCTQPRRISAVSVAERVALERSEVVGEKVGYSIRLESRLPKGPGTITYCTTGVVFQQLKHDPYLNRISHLIVDEVHERDVLSDFLLCFIKDLLIARPDLKVILMSATINCQHFAAYFNNCEIYHVPGFTYPVEEFFLEDALEATKFEFPPPSLSHDDRNSKHGGGQHQAKHVRIKGKSEQQKIYEQLMTPFIQDLQKTGQYSSSTIRQLTTADCEKINLDLTVSLIEHICATDEKNGSILVFLPGYDKISTLHQKLANSISRDQYLLIPLHSMMPTVNQREVFEKPPAGKRKIVIATNIAETSITIEDIIYVIDCGMIKMTNFDVENNIETLNEEWVSKANATQRRGRAGRTQPGICYHLYSRGREEMLEDFKKPEVLRKDLGQEILRIKLLKLGKAMPFFNRLMDAPSAESVELAITSLRRIHALDTNENLTPLGFHLAQLPLDPRAGKMILFGALLSCLNPILSIAASLTFKDPFYVPLGKEKEVDQVKRELSRGSKSDHITLLNAIEEYEFAKITNNHQKYCYNHFLSANTLHLLEDLKRQFAQYLKDLGFLKTTNYKDPILNLNSRNTALLKGVFCAGLYPNVAKIKVRRCKGGKGIPVAYTETDGRINIHPKSVNSCEAVFESPFMVYHHKMKTTSVFLYDTTMVTPTQLAFFGGQLDFLFSHGFGSVGVDETVRFLCRRDDYDIMEKLRKELDNLLEYKIQYPGPTNWNELTREGALLQAITELITSEYKMLMQEALDEDESDDEGYMYPNADF